MSTKTGMVSFSGGKDSTAMLIRLLELDDPEMPVTRIVFADTDFEFPELYEYIAKVEKYVQDRFNPELKVEFVKSPRSWDDWFYGEITRGANKGKQRGAPLRAYPCWWARESKVQPLQRAGKDADVIYIGIAKDEEHRTRNSGKHGKSGKDHTEDPRNARNRYPLVEWGWTEQDCFDYLDDLGLMNERYVNFTRLGCFHCIKQPPDAWWGVWRGYPELWEIAKEWDKESLRISNHGLRSMKKGDGWTLEEMEARFKAGEVPKSRTKFDCSSCDAVRFVAEGQMTLEDFVDTDDNAHERMGLIDEETPACDIVWGNSDDDAN